MDGLVLVDKPAGKTSHDLTLAVRRGLGVRKAGHAGTLDPFATGLLLVLVGRARRVQRYLTALRKTYVTVARLGALSTTGDPEGEITQTGLMPPEDAVLPTGRVLQRPPIYSAVRIKGRRVQRLRGIIGDGARTHFIIRSEAIHIDPSVLDQLLVEFPRKLFMMARVKITERVAHRKLLLFKR